MSAIFSTLKQNLSEPSLNIFLCVRRIFGSYCPTSDSKLKCLLLKSYCVAITATLISVFLSSKQYNIVFFAVTAEYALSSILSLFTAEQSFINFCNNIKISFALLGIRQVSLIPKNIFIIAISIVTYKVCFAILKNTVGSPMYLDNYLTFSIIVIARDINHFWLIEIFALLKAQMKLIRESIEANTIPVNIVGEDQVVMKIRQVRKSMFVYNYLLDNLEAVSFHMQYLELVILTTSVPILVLNVHSIIRCLVLQDSVFVLLRSILDFTVKFLCISCPAILAQLTINEVDTIKKTITKQLLRCSDESLRFQLNTALQYMTHRPFKFTVCRCFPLDSSLLIGLFTLTITYVIVFIQFNTLQ